MIKHAKYIRCLTYREQREVKKKLRVSKYNYLYFHTISIKLKIKKKPDRDKFCFGLHYNELM